MSSIKPSSTTPMTGLPPSFERSDLGPGLSRFRSRDSMGALKLSRAAADDEYARGYASGLSEGRADALESACTTLLALLEAKFGELGDAAMDRISEANHPQLRSYCLAVLTAESAEEALGL